MNPKEEDQTKAPSLLSRSVGLLRLELSNSQIASTEKLRKEFITRSEENSKACNILHNHQHVWASVDGPPVEALFRPSLRDIEQAKQCGETLQKMSEADDADELADC